MKKKKSNERKEENVTPSYKKRSRKLNLSENDSKTSTKGFVKTTRNEKDHFSDSSESSLPKRKNKPYEELSGEFKKIKSPTFNGEMEKGKEVEAWL